MVLGIAIQAVAIMVTVLLGFRIGLDRYPQSLVHAQTMAFATLSISELLRAYTARSEHYNIWQVGIFSNKYMQVAVLSSLAILVAILYIPFLQTIFGTAALTLQDWLVLAPLIVVPSVVAEITKFILRRTARQRYPAAGTPATP